MRATTGRRSHYRRAAHGCPPAVPDGVGSPMDTASDLNDGPSSRGRWLGAALLLATVLLAVLRSSTGTRLDSFTIDEPWPHLHGPTSPRADGSPPNPRTPPSRPIG